MRGKDATLGHFVDHQINKPKWDAWKALPEAVRTGQVAFAVAHGGLDMHQVHKNPFKPRSPFSMTVLPRCAHPHQSAFWIASCMCGRSKRWKSIYGLPGRLACRACGVS